MASHPRLYRVATQDHCGHCFQALLASQALGWGGWRNPGSYYLTLCYTEPFETPDAYIQTSTHSRQLLQVGKAPHWSGAEGASAQLTEGL